MHFFFVLDYWWNFLPAFVKQILPIAIAVSKIGVKGDQKTLTTQNDNFILCPICMQFFPLNSFEKFLSVYPQICYRFKDMKGPKVADNENLEYLWCRILDTDFFFQ